MSVRLSERYRTAFVTGASTGLGRAFAEMLLAEGVEVWGTSRDPSRLGSPSSGPGSRLHPVGLELRDGARAEQAFLAAEEQAGGFEIVINNAGYGVFGEFAATEFPIWEEQLQVMLVNTARLAHAALRQMRARIETRPGKCCALVNISSLAAEFPLPYQPAYNVCKAGLTALSESLMMECSGSPIVILDVRPGDYRTDFEGSVRQVGDTASVRLQRAWRAFGRMMQTGPSPDHAAASLRRALLRQKSGTVRTGRVFQSVVAPFLKRFGSLELQRNVQARYFDLR